MSKTRIKSAMSQKSPSQTQPKKPHHPHQHQSLFTLKPENFTSHFWPARSRAYPEDTGFGELDIWGKVKIEEQLLPDGNVDFETDPTPTPFPINPTEKALIWIWIHVQTDIPNDAQGETVTLYIEIVDDIAI